MQDTISLNEQNQNLPFIQWLSNFQSQLASMSREQNIVFLADCCQRLHLNYEKFYEETQWGNPSLLREGMQLLQDCATQNTDSSQITSLVTELLKVAPDTEDFTSAYTSAALDAVVALTRSLEYCVDGNVERGVQVACLCRDTACMFVSQRDQHGNTIDTDEHESRIYNDRLLEQELLAQQEAITRARR